MPRPHKILVCQTCGKPIDTPHRHRVTVMSEGLPNRMRPGETLLWMDTEFHRTICDECYRRVKDILKVEEGAKQ